MDTKNILALIDALPAYIQYIYPGYITIYLYMFFKEKSIKDSKYIACKSLALSYFYIEFLKFIRHVKYISFICNKLSETTFWELAQIIGLVAIATFVAYFAYQVERSKFAEKLLTKLKIDTELEKSEIGQLVDPQNGVWIIVYLKSTNIVYEGSLISYHLEDTANRKNITLCKYRKYQIDQNEKSIQSSVENHDADVSKQVVIYYDDILRIEKVQ